MAQILAFIMQSKYPRLQRVGAPRHSSSSSDAEPTILRNERPRLQSVRALGHRSSASAAQPASFGSVMTDSVNELAPEQIWTIRPSYPQPSSTEFERTHTTDQCLFHLQSISLSVTGLTPADTLGMERAKLCIKSPTHLWC